MRKVGRNNDRRADACIVDHVHRLIRRLQILHIVEIPGGDESVKKIAALFAILLVDDRHLDVGDIEIQCVPVQKQE